VVPGTVPANLDVTLIRCNRPLDVTLTSGILDLGENLMCAAFKEGVGVDLPRWVCASQNPRRKCLVSALKTKLQLGAVKFCL